MLRQAQAKNPTLRDLKIKTGVVKRISKELSAYEKEQQKQQERIDQLIKNNADDAEIRKQREVLAETVDIIPDCKQRLSTSHKELVTLLEQFKDQETEEVSAAKELLETISV